MRPIRKVLLAAYAPIADLITYSPLPSRTLQQIDPFLFLNHHGHQVYPANNRGLPFGPHPHRGMETVTFILEGDIMHQDSGGHQSVINAGGVQWMTAGRGLIHAEVSSDEFKKTGGPLEILQLWVNLPAKLKMTEPRYKGLQKDEIPEVMLQDGKVKLQVISGEWQNQHGPFESLTGVAMATLTFEKGGTFELQPPAEHAIFCYAVSGDLIINGTAVQGRQLVEFALADGAIKIQALEKSVLLLGHAKPLNEPVVAQGPFVMNTEEEIYEAYADYQSGKFGRV